MKTSSRWLLFGGVFAVLSLHTGKAATLQVTPTSLIFDIGGARANSVTLKNPSSEPVTVSVDLVSWTQANGQDVYAPTQDLLVNPARFLLPAFGEQIVRVGWRAKEMPSSEKTYRIVVQNLPQTPKPGEEGIKVQVVLRMSLPIVFKLPTAQAAVKWSVSKVGADLLLRADNSGNRFRSFNNLEVKLGDKANKLGSFAVLAGAYRSFTLEGWANDAVGSLKLSYDSAIKDSSETENVTLP